MADCSLSELVVVAGEEVCGENDVTAEEALAVLRFPRGWRVEAGVWTIGFADWTRIRGAMTGALGLSGDDTIGTDAVSWLLPSSCKLATPDAGTL